MMISSSIYRISYHLTKFPLYQPRLLYNHIRLFNTTNNNKEINLINDNDDDKLRVRIPWSSNTLAINPNSETIYNSLPQFFKEQINYDIFKLLLSLKLLNDDIQTITTEKINTFKLLRQSSFYNRYPVLKQLFSQENQKEKLTDDIRNGNLTKNLTLIEKKKILKNLKFKMYLARKEGSIEYTPSEISLLLSYMMNPASSKEIDLYSDALIKGMEPLKPFTKRNSSLFGFFNFPLLIILSLTFYYLFQRHKLNKSHLLNLFSLSPPLPIPPVPYYYVPIQLLKGQNSHLLLRKSVINVHTDYINPLTPRYEIFLCSFPDTLSDKEITFTEQSVGYLLRNGTIQFHTNLSSTLLSQLETMISSPELQKSMGLYQKRCQTVLGLNKSTNPISDYLLHSLDLELDEAETMSRVWHQPSIILPIAPRQRFDMLFEDLQYDSLLETNPSRYVDSFPILSSNISPFLKDALIDTMNMKYIVEKRHIMQILSSVMLSHYFHFFMKYKEYQDSWYSVFTPTFDTQVKLAQSPIKPLLNHLEGFKVTLRNDTTIPSGLFLALTDMTQVYYRFIDTLKTFPHLQKPERVEGLVQIVNFELMKHKTLKSDYIPSILSQTMPTTLEILILNLSLHNFVQHYFYRKYILSSSQSQQSHSNQSIDPIPLSNNTIERSNKIFDDAKEILKELHLLKSKALDLET